ncbi:phosphoribosylpyrophosphate synthetase [Croceiramulus getboli]|nr:phosphoribosylpyrophosphate synthetase [Flavobacteriaceae bacterium YJPT1-3]
MKKDFDTLSEATRALQKDGYTLDFNLADEGVQCKALNAMYNADELQVDSYYRFEGKANPADNSIVYALSTGDGKKGILVDGYGAKSQSVSPEIIDLLKIERD